MENQEDRNWKAEEQLPRSFTMLVTDAKPHGSILLEQQWLESNGKLEGHVMLMCSYISSQLTTT